MTIALRGSAFPAGANTATPTATIPGTTQAGDRILVLAVVAGNSTPLPVDPAGYTRLGYAQGSNTNHWLIGLTKTAVSGDAGATVTESITGPTTTGLMVLVYYDTAGGQVDVDGSAFTTGGSYTMPSLTTSAADCVAVGAASVRNSNGTDTWTVPSGYTARGHNGGTGGSGKAWTAADNLTPVAAGTNVGGGVFVASVAGANSCALTIALKVTSAPPDIPSGAAYGALSWTTGEPPTVADLTTPQFAAHRGGMGEGPSETMAAYNQSMPLGLWLLAEGDCQLNADGSIVLWHDDTIDGSTTVVSQTDADWDALTVDWPSGHSGVPSPAPAAYWSQLADQWGGKRILIPEMKDSGAVDSVLQTDITTRGLVESTIIQCFDYTRAKAAAANGFHVMYLVGATAPDFADVASFGIEFVGMSDTGSNIDSTVCSDAHAAGITLWAYTVNSTTARDTLLAAGVDGFFTNFPSTVATNILGSAVGHAPAVGAKHGTVSGGHVWAGGAVGHAEHTGTAAGAHVWAGSAAGSLPAQGTATGGYGWTGAAAGSTVHEGTATGAHSWAGTSTGHADHDGTTSGAHAWHGTSTGSTDPAGTAAGGITWAGSSIGHAPDLDHPHGHGIGGVAWTGTATGRAPAVAGKSGSSTGSYGYSGSATGHHTPKGSTTGAYGWLGGATGHAPTVDGKHGTSGGGYQFTGHAAGSRSSSGSTHGAIVWTGAAHGRNGHGRNLTVTAVLAPQDHYHAVLAPQPVYALEDQ